MATAYKLDIGKVLRQFDLKNRNYYDSLNEEEKKALSPFMMIRWGSSIEYNKELSREDNYMLQAYFLRSVNDNLNKDFYSINTAQHKKLQWLIATTVSPGKAVMGDIPRHEWISNKKPKDALAKTMDFFREIYPHLKDDELKLLVEINDRADIENLAREHGWDNKRIKSDL